MLLLQGSESLASAPLHFVHNTGSSGSMEYQAQIILNVAKICRHLDHCTRMLMVSCNTFVWHTDQKAVWHSLAAILDLAVGSHQHMSS